MLTEEQQFAKTLDQGMGILEAEIKSHTLKAAPGAFEVIPGEVVFKLYDTYGFPVDLTGDIARERGLRLDEAGLRELWKLSDSERVMLVILNWIWQKVSI